MERVATVTAAAVNGKAAHSAPVAPARPTPVAIPTSGGSKPALTGAAVPAGPAAVVSDRARVELDTLLRMLVTKNASDLHLRCGEPPVLVCSSRAGGDLGEPRAKPRKGRAPHSLCDGLSRPVQTSLQVLTDAA